jgi:alkylhydroperoxidase/carboxymuconolactone decarboxylase family protein YurZ
MTDVLTPDLVETGPWDRALTMLEQWDPAWAAACKTVSTSPWKSGVLSRKLVELISLAINVACTNLNADGTRRHIRAALDAGATRDEILFVVKCATAMALDSCSLGAPILLEEAKVAGGRARVRAGGPHAGRRQDEGDRAMERGLGRVPHARSRMDGRLHGDGRRHLRERRPAGEGD